MRSWALPNHEVKFNRKPIRFQLSYFNVFLEYLKTQGHQGPREYLLQHATITDHANRGRGLVVILEDAHTWENSRR